MGNQFFKERQGAAVLKHGLLRRYLPKFFGKTGSRAERHRVVYVDGFAGMGGYDDGTPGSPVLAATVAANLDEWSSGHVCCYYVEQDAATVEVLRAAVSNLPHQHRVLHGTAAEHVPWLLKEHNVEPMFVFLDPFGLVDLPMADLVLPILQRDGRPRLPHNPPTELLLHFSIPGFSRHAGNLTLDAQSASRRKSGETLVGRLDEALGGSWWQELWLSGIGNRTERVAREFASRTCAAAGGGWLSWVIPVSDDLGAAPSYYLVFFTRSLHGIFTLNEQLSLAFEVDFTPFCHRDQALLPIDPGHHYVEVLKSNLKPLLEAGRVVHVGDKFGTVFKDVLGLARTKHLRQAVSDLHKAGVAGRPLHGDVSEKTVIYPARLAR